MIPGTALLARAETFADRHEKALSVVALIALALSTANTAHFIDLPDPPYFGDSFWIFAGGAWNAVWWGFLRPALMRRREERRSTPDQPGE